VFKYFTVVLTVFFINPNWVDCQDYIYKNYNVSDGLSSSEVYHCLQDSKGYIWFATDNGVSRFDGYRFVNFDIQSGLIKNTVLDLFEDNKGRIWFISISGELCYYYNSKIIPYQYNSLIVAANKGFTVPVKQSFYVDSLDNVYLSLAYNGIFKIDSKGVLSNLEDIKYKGYIYFHRLSNTMTLKGFHIFGDVQGVIENDSIINYDIDAKYSRVSLLFRVSGDKQESFISYKQSIYKLKNGRINKVAHFSNDILWFNRDKNGNYWISVLNSGISFYYTSDFTNQPNFVFLKGKDVSSVFIDNENGLWFTTLTDGVNYLPSNKIHCVDLSEFNTQNVISVGLSPGKVWLGIDKGKILAYDNKFDRKLEKIIFGETDHAINISYHPYFKKMIFGTHRYVYTYGNGELRKLKNISKAGIKVGAFNKACRSVIISNDNYFYVGTNSGLDKFNINEVVYTSVIDRVFEKISYALLENADKSVWIGTQDGLWKFENGKYLNWATKNVQLEYRINALYKKENTLFIGTKGAGLMMLNLLNDSVKCLSLKDGLSSNSITSITGKDNAIWLGTNKGVNRINFLTDSAYQISRLDAGNGLINNEINQIVQDDSMLYIATKGGFNYINLNQFEWTSVKPKLNIEQIKINSADTIIANYYHLDYFKQNIQISYVAISYKSDKNIIYKYRLWPLEKDWKTSTQKNLNYTTLPPGTYIFTIKARNESGIWSETSKPIYFVIDKPFWKKWWFFLLPTAFIAAIIYLILLQRIEKLKHQNKLKNELNNYMKKAVNMMVNEHFLFNSLNSLNHLILSGEKLESGKLLIKISNYFRAVLSSIKKDFIKLYDEINIVKLYLDIEKHRLKDKFIFDLQIDSSLNLHELFIPGVFIQPFIEASIWSGKTNGHEQIKLDISIKTENEFLLIEIQCNKKLPNHSMNRINDLALKETGDIDDWIMQRTRLINDFYNWNVQVDYQTSKNENGMDEGRILRIKVEIKKIDKQNMKHNINSLSDN